ncbi:hypothetical protein BC937DRAFT_94571 [Endogone sp. FLAS-F59071]|nr:hypothetical protein BC937DRAFT_94571 [Endogone sp. FLAS-F59071]|eukprot:RUS13943.1 hypothetical protein BC937DRAFT_94571 [Endogone sp. FLAS-F59071]
MNKDDLVSKFVDIVSCTAEQATFYLEANKWDINLAMSQYYEGIPPPQSSSHATTLDEDEDDDEDDEYSERPYYGDSNPASDSGLNSPESSRPTTRSKSGAKSA